MKNNILLLIFFLSLAFSETLLNENFNSGDLPAGWSFTPDPSDYPSNTGTWQINNWNTDFNNSAPAATYYWSPASPSGYANYEGHYMYSNEINVTDTTNVLVRFKIALDGFPTPTGHYNGMRVAYKSDDQDWTTVLSYQISAESGATVDINPRVETFYARMGQTLQLRWEAFGTNSYHIDAWHIDDVEVIVIPTISNVSISSNNDDDNQKAIPGDIVTLTFTVPEALASGSPFVLINSNQASINNSGGLNYQATYVVPDDATDGPVAFSIDFTTQNGISGPTERSTSDGTSILIDVTGPATPVVSENVSASGGTEVPNIWNGSNENVLVEVAVPNDTAVVAFTYSLGNCVSFIGSNGTVNIPASNASGDLYKVTNEFTFEAYIKVNNQSDYQGFFDYGNYSSNLSTQAGMGFFLYGGGWRFFLKTTNDGNFSQTDFVQASASLNTWTHFAVKLKNGTLTLIRDGVVVASKSGYNGNVEWSGFNEPLMYLGSFSSDAGGGTNYFDGKMDEVRFWNVARSDNEIKAYRNVGLSGNEEGLIGYWRLDEDSGTSVVDSSLNNNNGNISGGANWELGESEFFFQEDLLDPNVIIGSKFQILSKINENALEPVGEKFTITENDLSNGNMILSTPGNEFENISGFAHNDTAYLSARLFDQAGNYADGNISETSLYIDLQVNDPIAVNIVSNNTFSHLAKIGDELTISVNYDEDVDLPLVRVDGNDAIESSLGNNRFQATSSPLGDEPEGYVDYLSISTNDYMGNSGTYSGGATAGITVYYDKTIPTVSNVNIRSNRSDPNWATIGDTVRVDFTGSETTYLSEIKISDSTVVLKDTSGLEYNGFTQCSGGTIVTNGLKLWLDADDIDGDGVVEGFSEDGLIGSDVSIWKDKSGNGADCISVTGSGLPTLNENLYSGKNALEFNKSESDALRHELGSNQWMATEFSLFIVFAQKGTPQIYDSFFSNGTPNNAVHFQISKQDDNFNFFTGTYTIPFEEWDNELKVYGVIGSTTSTTTIIDGEQINSEEITSGRTFEHYRINQNRSGNKFNDSYISEILLYDRELTEAELTQTYQYLGRNYGLSYINDSKDVHAHREMTDSDAEGLIQFSVGHNDCSGNDGATVTETSNNSYVIFDRTPPSDFTTDSVITIGGTPIVNKWNSTNLGLEVGVTVDSDTSLINGSIQIWSCINNNAFEILGSSIEISSSDLSTQKTFSFAAEQVEAMSSFSEQDTIKVRAVITDRVDLETIGEISTNKLIIDQTLPLLKSVSCVSNFSDSSMATIGHIISVSFETEPLLSSPTITISGNPGSVTSVDGDSSWVGTYTMQETDSEGIIPFMINDLVDLSGNPASGFVQTTDSTSVIFDNSKPTLDSVSIYSNNTNSSFAKVGDSVMISFVGEELLTSQSVSIVSQPASVSETSDDKKHFLASYIMQDLDQEGVIRFGIVVTDSVGLVSDTVSNTSDESRVTFDRKNPYLPWVNITSSNEVNEMVGVADDDVYLKFIPDSALIFDSISVTISNRIAIISQSIDTLIATISIIGEGTDSAGILPFTIDFMDHAGNRGTQVTTTSDGSFVNHDVGPPEIVSVRIWSSNQDSSWSKIGDTVFVQLIANEPLSNSSIQIGGRNSIQDIPTNSPTHQGYIIMENSDSENCLQLSISYSDLGGLAGIDTDSTTDGSRVCFDKTPPQVNNISVRTNNTYGDSLAKTGDTDTLLFSISEIMRDINLIFADSENEPQRDLLNFTATHTFAGTEEEGLVGFNIFVIDSAGNSSDSINATDDLTQVRYDRTLPTLITYYIYSSNSNDTSLCIIGDSILVDFTASERLGPSRIVSIAGNSSINILDLGENNYRALYVIDGSEDEGYLRFTIEFEDWVGNTGITIDTTHGSNSGYVLFDQSPPEDFSIDTVFVNGLIDEAGYWNSSSDSVTILVPASEVDQSLLDGECQLQISFDGGAFIDAGDPINITNLGILNLNLTRNNFISLPGYSEGSNVSFTAVIKDRAGNNTVGGQFQDSIHIDETRPSLYNISFTNNNEFGSHWTRVGDQANISFDSDEGLKNPILTIHLDTVNLSTTNSGLDWTGIYDLGNETPEGLLLFSIFSKDSAGNTSDTISITSDGTKILLDRVKPEISGLLEGNDSIDLDYYNRSDSLALFWFQNDTLSNVRTAIVNIGLDSQLSSSIFLDTINWALINQQSEVRLGNLNFVNESKYYSSVFIEDSAGNHSDTLYSDGLVIDLIRPDTGSINDGDWVIELDYTIDSTSLLYKWEGFSDNIGINNYELSIGTCDILCDTTNVLDWLFINNSDGTTVSNLNLQRDIEYRTFIRAVDSASNKSLIAETDGIYFDDSVPQIIKIIPDINDTLSTKYLSVFSDDTIKIKFNRQVFFYNVDVKTSLDTGFVFSQSYADSMITITWEDTLYSYDTIKVYLDSALAYNALFITDTLEFFTPLWGDLNDDYEINVADILLFNSQWPEVDLAPYTKSPPHVRPYPDGESNIEDLRAFAKMWQWRYQNLSYDTTVSLSRFAILNQNLENRKLKLDVPENTLMSEILIGNSNLDITKFSIEDLRLTVSKFVSVDEKSQKIFFGIADKNGFNDSLSIRIPKTDQEFFSGKIQYKFFNNYGDVVSNGMLDVNMKLVPEIFAVYPNYPNPFNATTTVKFDLPKKASVDYEIFNLLGKSVFKSGKINFLSGKHSIFWNGKSNDLVNVGSGIYFLQIRTGGRVHIQKMVLIK